LTKYINKAERVIAFGNKFSIPGTEPIELTDAEVANPFTQLYIKDGVLVEVPESVQEPTEETKIDIDTMTVKQLQDYAVTNNIDLGDAAKKEDILALIKAVK